MIFKAKIIKNMTRQGFQGMWRNRSMGLASVGSISAVLLILGLVLIMILSINNVVAQTSGKFDEIEVFIEDDVKEEDLASMKSELEEIDGIKLVTFKSKEEALEEMKEDWKDNLKLLDGVESKVLPSSYILKLEDINKADSIIPEVEKIEGIEEVKYFQEAIDKLIVFTNYIQKGGFLLIGVLVLVSIFIISNTIKVTVGARKKQIEIMKYVGATNGYIRGPFIIEGVLFGLLGALLSVLLINLGYKWLFNMINKKSYLLSKYLISPKTLMTDIIIIFISIGAGIGALGSMVSLKRFLNV